MRRLPLSFEPNQGQAAASVRFLARGPGYGVFLTPDVSYLSLRGTAPVALRFVHANRKASFAPAAPLPGHVNYFQGRGARHAGIPLYARVVEYGVYAGIDAVYHGSQQQLEFDFEVAPAADPSQIEVAVTGAAALRLAKNGDLVLSTNSGPVTFKAPNARQDGHPVPVAFAVRGRNSFGFRMGSYNRAAPLLIDPILAYASYLGGSSIVGDSASAVAVDSTGNAYVVGTTNSTSFPVVGGVQGSCGFGCQNQRTDAFISKVSPDGSKLIYSTYLGGKNSDQGLAVAVDAAGEAVIGGGTFSIDFPTTPAAYQPSCPLCITLQGPGIGVPFVAKLSADGSSLIYSTYLVDSTQLSRSGLTGLALSPSGNAIIAGSGLPTTAGAINAGQGMSLDSLSADGSKLIYGAQLGNSGGGGLHAVAVDPSGAAYVAGISQTFPTTAGAFDTACASPQMDTFVAKVVPDGSQFAYATCLGGIVGSNPGAIAVDGSGDAWVTGATGSPDFPVTSNAAQSKCSSCGVSGRDAYLTEFSPDGSEVLYSTFFGGSGDDFGLAVALDSAANAWFAGETASSDFPTLGPLWPTPSSASNNFESGFIVKMAPSGSVLFSSAFPSKMVSGLASDANGGIYLVGQTPPGLPVTRGAFQATPGGNWSGFVAKIGDPALAATPTSLVFASQPVGVTSSPQSVTLTSSGSAPLTISAVTTTGNFAESGTCASPIPVGATCTIAVTFDPSALGAATGTLTIADDTAGSPHTVSLSGTGIQGPQSITFGAIGAQTYGVPVDLGATASSALPVAYAVAGPATLAGNVVSPTGVGSVTVTASQPGNATYAAAVPVAQTFTVSPASITVAAANATSTYGDTLPKLAYTLAGFVNHDTQNVVTGTAAVSTTGTSASPAGDYPITATLGTLAAANYTFQFTPGTLAIGKAALTVTATDATMAFGAALPTFTAAFSGFVNGDTASAVSGTAAFSTTASSTSPVGNYPVTPVAGTLSAANYAFTFVSGTLTVTPASQTITFPAIANHTFGDAPIALAATASSSLPVTYTIVSGPATVNGSTLTLAGVGTVVVEADQAGSSNYAAAAPVRQSFTVAAAPGVSIGLTPPTVTFESQGFGTASPPQTVTLTNTGQGPVAIASIAASGDFAETSACGSALAVGANCSVALTFTPTATGARSGSLVITDSAAGSPQSVALTGTGSDLGMAPAGGSSASSSVAAGQPASFKLTLTAFESLSGTFTISCAGAPAESTCTPSPASLTLAAGTSVPLAVSISTTARSVIPELPIPTDPDWLFLLYAAALCTLLARARLARARPARRRAVGAMLFASLALLVACGGGSSSSSSSSPPPPSAPAGTPAGTYKLVVSATNAQGTVVGSTALSLTVQ